MSRCSISLLGAIQFNLDGSPLQGLESEKVRGLLAYLVVESDQVHTREKLVGLFWPEVSEAQARHRLSQALHNLRQALGEMGKPEDRSVGEPYLLTTRHTVQFNPSSDHWLDVRAFEQTMAEIHQHDHRRLETCQQCARLLMVVEELYRGDFLSGISLRNCQAFEEWALVWRERLHRHACEVLEILSRYYEGRGEMRQALEANARWANIDPFNEPALRGLMRLLALNGQRTQALVRYNAFHRLLAVELEVEPGLDTQILYQHILDEETAQASLPGMSGRLPVPLTPFVGREDELAELAAWLRDRQTRLVTLLGPGGSGKTRLALQVAHSLRYDFPDGIFLVSLSGVGSREAFLPAVANALGVSFQPEWGDRLSQLQGYLRGRHLLLILDSFEEVLEAAEWLPKLLRAAPRVQLLVTSRARLNIQAEQIFLLQGLGYPDPDSPATQTARLADYPALQLFHNTATQVNPDHLHLPADLPVLARICQLVDGMPLGIMLAAAWMGTCTANEIVIQIEGSLDFLAASWSDVPYRQRSLRATLDHSWQMLTADEQRAFEKLSVFQGVFNRQAAEQVAGVCVSALRCLVDKSMLQASPDSYWMHGLLRQYGAEKLAGDEASAGLVRDAHSSYYLERLAEGEAGLKSHQRSATLKELDAEINDIQAAWEWACQQSCIPVLERSLEGMGLYYQMRVRYQEGEHACQAALSALAADVETDGEAMVLKARLLLWRENFLVLSGELATAKRLRQEAGKLLEQLEVQGIDARRPRAMYWQAEGIAQKGLKARLDCYLRGIALYQEQGDTWREATVLIWVASVVNQLGDPGLAMQKAREALHLARQIGEPSTLLYSLRRLAYVSFTTNQFEAARQVMQEMSAALERVEELPLRAATQMHLGVLLGWSAQFSDCIRALESALPILRSLGYRDGAVYGSLVLGICLMMKGEYSRAESILQAVVTEAELEGMPREAASGLLAQGMVALAQEHLAQAGEYFQQSVLHYRRMQFAGELGWALGGLALAQLAVGQSQPARESLIEALTIAAQAHSMFTMNTSLAAMAAFLFHEGNVEVALRVHRLAMRQPVQQKSHWYADIIGKKMEAHWQALSVEKQEEIETTVAGHTPFSIIPQVLELIEAG